MFSVQCPPGLLAWWVYYGNITQHDLTDNRRNCMGTARQVMCGSVQWEKGASLSPDRTPRQRPQGAVPGITAVSLLYAPFPARESFKLWAQSLIDNVKLIPGIS